MRLVKISASSGTAADQSSVVLYVLGELALAAQQVALEVVVVAGDDAGLVEELNDLAAQVVGLRVGPGFAIDGAPDQQLRACAFAQEGVRSADAARRRRCGTGGRGCPRRRCGLPATSFSIQRSPASMLAWWMRLPSMS